MNLRDAIRTIMPLVREAHVLTATGFISREACEALDRPEHFYVIGSMGQVSSLGLGVATAHPERTVVVLDGDGSVLMNLGLLAMVGAQAPRNYHHVALDNGVYASTGNQRTCVSSESGSESGLDAYARAAGYRVVVCAATLDELAARLPRQLSTPGPTFTLVRVSPDLDKPAPRVPHEPDAMTARFRATLLTHS